MTKIKYTFASYLPYDLREKQTDETMKIEYTRLRKAATSRLKALERAGYSDSETYKLYKDAMPPVSTVSQRELPYRLREVYNFLEDKHSLVSAQRSSDAARIATLNAHGYNVKAENIREFGRFMKWASDTAVEVSFSSEQIAEFFEDEQDAVTPDLIVKKFEQRVQEKKLEQDEAERIYNARARHREKVSRRRNAREKRLAKNESRLQRDARRKRMVD